MNLTQYTEWTKTTALYPEQTRVVYPALGIINEIGEFVGKVKKQIRGDKVMAADDLLSELADVLWYTARTADDAGISLPSVVHVMLDEESQIAMDDPNFGVVSAIILSQFGGDVGSVLEDAGIKGSNVNTEALRQVCNGVLAAIAISAKSLGSSVEDLIDRSVAKLEDRKARGVIKGDGDNR